MAKMNEAMTSKVAYLLAIKSVRSGDKSNAAHWCRIALELDPNNVDAWLMLGGLSKHKASLAYIKQALELAPNNETARKAMHWAIEEERKRHYSNISQQRVFRIQKQARRNLVNKRPAIVPWLIILAAVIIGGTIWSFTPMISYAYNNNVSQPKVEVAYDKATFTPTFTPTNTPTPTYTPTPTPTDTPTSTPTYTPSPTATVTDTPLPTATYVPTSTPKPDDVNKPVDVGKGERWIDIDLSQQMLYAYEGKNLVNSFVISSGTWQHPTVIGQYYVYVKYRYADMSGPGYYLPDVPYVMYFYKGYGIHGTYWHNNFGTPMSHGCVNMETSQAGWVYDWSSVGTLVNVHE